jgi:signal transduction histidine kinase
MTGSPSIRRRLSRVVIQVSLAWSLAVFGVVWFIVHHQIDKVLDSSLQESAEFLYGVLSSQARLLPPGKGDSLPAPLHVEHLVWQVVDPQGMVTWRSHGAPNQPLLKLGESSHAHAEWPIADDAWHVHGMKLYADGTMLYVAQPHEDRRRAQGQAAMLTALGALGVGLACAWWLRWQTTRELRPLEDLSRQVGLYHPLAPDAQPLVAAREELLPLKMAITQLGERLARMVASERAFSANAAHALRTPLAGLGAQLALAERESPPAVQPRIQRAREASNRLSRVVTALLTLFRSGGEATRQALELGAFMQNLPMEGLVLHVDGTCQAQADADLLAAALLNLLDNSLRLGATEVRCTFTNDAEGTHIQLQDNGPGADAATLKRLDQALASQHYEHDTGLGLMLADHVARAHGGHLKVLPCASGFCVSLTLAKA